MAEELKEKLALLSEKLRIGGTEMGKKVSTGVGAMSEKVKDLLLLKVGTPAGKMVEELTSSSSSSPPSSSGPKDPAWWAKSMELCDILNSADEQNNRQDAVRALKRHIMSKKNPRSQLLALILLETCVKNCEKLFFYVSSEHLLDEMVKAIDDPDTPIVTRDKALKLLEAWGESGEHLRSLPMFEETYKSLKSRGVKFPLRDPESLAPVFTPPQSVATPVESPYARQGSNNEILIGRHVNIVVFPDALDVLSVSQITELFSTARNCLDLLSTVLSSSPQHEVLQDELTTALAEQCYHSQFSVQRVVEHAGDNEALLFEALNLNDDLQKVLAKYEEMRRTADSSEQMGRPSTNEPPISQSLPTVAED